METGWVNPPLRFSDEPCRHKLLDLLGDLALCAYNGHPGLPVAHIVAYKVSYSPNSLLECFLLWTCVFISAQSCWIVSHCQVYSCLQSVFLTSSCNCDVYICHVASSSLYLDGSMHVWCCTDLRFIFNLLTFRFQLTELLFTMADCHES